MPTPLIVNTATRDELGDTIGREKLETLTLRFRDLLATSLEAVGRDGADVGREAHSLISMAGMLGCDALSMACRDLEHATKRGDDFAPHLGEALRIRDATLAALRSQ